MANIEASWDSGTKSTAPRKPWWRRPIGRVVIGMLGVIALYRLATLLLIGSFTVPTSSMENTILTGDRVWVTRSSASPVRGEIVAFEFPGMRDEVMPRDEQIYLGRVVAIGGDTLEIQDNQVFVNGVPEAVAKGMNLRGESAGTGDQSNTFPFGYGYSHRTWGPLRIPKKGDLIDLSDPRLRSAWDVFVRRDLLGSDPGLDPRELLSEALPSVHTVRGDYYFALGDNRDFSMDSRYWGFVPVSATFGRPFMIYMSIDPAGGFRSDRMFMTVGD